MAQPEDCASVLDQFVQDGKRHIDSVFSILCLQFLVANLPAEITHLMEEIQAKDKLISDCRSTVNQRDGSLQKFIKVNGSLVSHPKEEPYNKTILQNMDRAQTLQDEKIALSDKACILLDRQIKRLDTKIRDLQNEGILSTDPPLPSLFRHKDQYRDPHHSFFPDLLPPEHGNFPLQSTSGNSGLQMNIAHRLANPTARAGPTNPSVLAAAHQLHPRNSAPATPASAAIHLQQRHRESSAGAIDSKRRRLNSSLGTLPAASSNLRQSSLGPGTPKAGTPGSTRAGSAGPRASIGTKKMTKKVAPHQQIKRLKASSKPSKRLSSTSGRHRGSALKGSASSAGGDDEDSVLSSADVSDSESQARRNRSSADDDDEEVPEDAEGEEDDAGDDKKLYCTCQTVSHGDMVMCENEECPYQWFHFKCVGITKEPVGEWVCDYCKSHGFG